MDTVKTRPSANETRESILESARRLFCDKGFAATSISEIAKAATVNQSLIYHHFESKEHLWCFVKSSLLHDYMNSDETLFGDLLELEDAKQFIESFVRLRFRIYKENPSLRRMVAWQVLEMDHDAIYGLSCTDISVIEDKIVYFQKKNLMRKDLDKQIILVMLLKFPSTFFYTHLYQSPKTKPRMQSLEKAYIDEVVDMLIKQVCAK